MSGIHTAIVFTNDAKEVGAYLPQNYRVIGRTLDQQALLIHGEDNAGWTLRDYVIPRLGSGLIRCDEVESPLKG